MHLARTWRNTTVRKSEPKTAQRGRTDAGKTEYHRDHTRLRSSASTFGIPASTSTCVPAATCVLTSASIPCWAVDSESNNSGSSSSSSRTDWIGPAREVRTSGSSASRLPRHGRHQCHRYCRVNRYHVQNHREVAYATPPSLVLAFLILCGASSSPDSISAPHNEHGKVAATIVVEQDKYLQWVHHAANAINETQRQAEWAKSLKQSNSTAGCVQGSFEVLRLRRHEPWKEREGTLVVAASMQCSRTE